MRGVGRASAAISIVNALPTGIGCAHGVRLYVAIAAEIDPGTPFQVAVDPEESRTPVVIRSAEVAVSRLGSRTDYNVHLHLDSKIPVAKGLKSSSAVSTATIQAVADAFHSPLPPIEVARMAASVGREVGVSASGAFDDALAGLLPGFVVTDNSRGELLLRRPADPEWTAVVHIPPGTHPRSPGVQGRFQPPTPEAVSAAQAAREGAWTVAMEQNTVVVERAMGYDYQDLRDRLRREGAVASGVSGLGPALVALVPRGRAESALRALPSERFVVPLASEAHS